MKTVTLFRDHDFWFPDGHGMIAYKEGMTYPNQPEAAVADILAKGAGKVVGEEIRQPQSMAVLAQELPDSRPTGSKRKKRKR